MAAPCLFTHSACNSRNRAFIPHKFTWIWKRNNPLKRDHFRVKNDGSGFTEIENGVVMDVPDESKSRLQNISNVKMDNPSNVDTKAIRKNLDIDEVVVFEAKVVLAMTRLQKSAYNLTDGEGIDASSIVDYLSKRYLNLDGDIESQVITALQSGIKKGFICGLRNGNYSLIGPNPSRMVGSCYNTVPHGPKCTCFLITSGKRNCCSFKTSDELQFRKAAGKVGGPKKKAPPKKRKTPKKSMKKVRKVLIKETTCEKDLNPTQSSLTMTDSSKPRKRRKLKQSASLSDFLTDQTP